MMQYAMAPVFLLTPVSDLSFKPRETRGFAESSFVL